MKLTIHTGNDGVAMILVGRLDTVTAPDFDRQVSEVINPVEHDITIDCAGLEYISSAGLRSLIVMLKAAKASGHKLTLRNISATILPIFEMTGFSTLFNL